MAATVAPINQANKTRLPGRAGPLSSFVTDRVLVGFASFLQLENVLHRGPDHAVKVGHCAGDANVTTARISMS
jgi:hypothetical protein